MTAPGSSARAGSSVGRPSPSSAHPSGIFSPRRSGPVDLAARGHAGRHVENEGPRGAVAIAAAVAIARQRPGPSSFWRPPHGASAGDELVNTRLTMPASAACRTAHAAMPKWLDPRTDTSPTPQARAMSTAAATARCVARNPKPLCPSTCGPRARPSAQPGSNKSPVWVCVWVCV